MERRHFELIARVIRDLPESSTLKNIDSRVDGRDHAAMRFADALANTNPRFDRAKFLKACGATDYV